MIQWGTHKWHPANYTTQNFKPKFASPPNVICTPNAASQNDAYCNVATISNESFQTIAVKNSQPIFESGALPINWVAIGPTVSNN